MAKDGVTIQFEDTEEGKARFRIIYIGYLLGSEGNRGLEALDVALAVQDKFNAISDEGEAEVWFGARIDVRKLRAGGGAMPLTRTQYDRILKHLNNVPWTEKLAREARDALVFLKDAKDD